MTPREWVSLFAAALTPMIAIVAAFIGVQNHRLAIRRRKDELFDRRYEYYQRVRNIWLDTENYDLVGPLDQEDLIPIATEAEFIFGDDISNHIISLANKRHKGHPSFPNEEFIKPFRKYLSLEGEGGPIVKLKRWWRNR